MTAAALKPNLMTHLIATRPEPPDRGTLSASLISVVLHAAIGSAAVWASLELKPAPVRLTPDVVRPITIAAPLPTSPGAAAPPRSSGPGSDAAVPVLPVPDPTIVDIPLASPVADVGFAPVGPPEGEAATLPGNGGGTRPIGGAGNHEFQAVSVLPALINAREIQLALERAYPPVLRDARIGGRAHLWLSIDENGYVVRVQLKESSGQRALDEVALQVAPLMRFSPAMNRDQRVKVMVHVPLEFRTN